VNAPRQLVLDFLGWLDEFPRTYTSAMDAWRTSCPRLPVWEDAIEQRLIARISVEGAEAAVVLTNAGRAMLEESNAIARAGVTPEGAQRGR
jgi:hypothetical protein